ncbi:VanZ family protein [Candidatus Scalindua japonica]|uniref:VanZ family protein n=1 Tax=Candidatus Scalindua japonica TaxID=1284222 RepID=UPI000BDF92EA
MRKLLISFYVLYLLILTYFFLTPVQYKVSESIWDKLPHFTAYLLLVILIKKVHFRLNYLICIIICCIYSFFIECIQYLIPNRNFDILDMLANLLGTIVGVMIYYFIINKHFNRNGIK